MIGENHPIIVGYDLIDKNITLLKKGQIHFIIDQSLQDQANLGINYLKDLLIFKKEIPMRKLFPLGVVTKENLNSYVPEV